MIESNGDVYEGDWVDNMMHGTGKYTTSDGTVYEGQFFEEKYIGEWVEIRYPLKGKRGLSLKRGVGSNSLNTLGWSDSLDILNWSVLECSLPASIIAT